MDKTYRLTLNRWHKVAERLSRRANDIAEEVRTGFNQTEVMGHLGEDQQARLSTEGERLAGLIPVLFDLQSTIAQIRKALGTANEATGISSSLAELDMLNKQLRLMESLINGQEAGLVGIDELPNLPVRVQEESGLFARPSTFRVRIMPDSALEAYRRKLEDIRTESFAVADKIAARNREALPISISENVARLAGLTISS
ncbi:MAG: hypothetical protein DIZ78_05960 [endosymbiont of Escarpia spicata]|uniref:Uncharacterized protein n=1 Tax=endosymbiont of Escarpia spicata TaxID=2200908 RepID=A0A370DS98_9GAMM|nr:MAG: hypothetical protein DIZ78_05960 [endosymbiont of Escarpia spicata]